ncbi:MAG: hypothetical protein N2258_07310 [Brevinematales bacterium]|nr:hypothetical protein [Brevinematales bacterium]
MDFMWNGVFWGIVLIIFGLSVILKAIFHIDIPIFKIFVAFFFIYLGVKILIGDKIIKPAQSNKDIVFAEGDFSYSNEDYKEYNIIFGSGRIDLSKIENLTSNKTIKINTVFGSGILYLKKNSPFRLKTSVAFGGINFPDGEAIYFGEKNISEKDKNTYTIDIELNVVFAGFRIFYRD